MAKSTSKKLAILSAAAGISLFGFTPTIAGVALYSLSQRHDVKVGNYAFNQPLPGASFLFSGEVPKPN